MSVNDLRCDGCGCALAGPLGGPVRAGRLGVRFSYHPGTPAFRDDSGMLCEPCWEELSAWLGDGVVSACAVCRMALEEGRLVISRPGETRFWLLCRTHAVEFLNRLRTVEPKMDPATFAFPEAAEGRSGPALP